MALINELTARIKEQLIANGITDFKITNGTFHFANIDDKFRANEIIHEYLECVLNDDAECLM